MAEDGYETATNDFLEWARHSGIILSNKCSLVDLRPEGRGRGIVASGDFEEDELIFTIPRSAVLNMQNATHNPSSQTASQDTAVVEDIPSWLRLTIILMVEALHLYSNWKPYLAILPSELDSLMFWSSAELQELQASAVLEKIGRAEAETWYYQKVAPLGLIGGTLGLFHGMASIIMAYAFDIPRNLHGDIESDTGEDLSSDEDDHQVILTMIPLADTLNADAENNNARLICDKEDLEMRSTKPICKGDEILNDYGLLPRSDLLRRYGYITDRYTRYDVAELFTKSIISTLQASLILDSEDKLEPLEQGDLDVRLELAKREDVYEDSYDVSHASAEWPCIPDNLLALCYLLLVDVKTLGSILSSESALPSRSKMATALVGKITGKLLRLRELEYGTNFEEDCVILEAGGMPHRMSMAVKIRQGEKMVLREAMAEAASFQGSDKRMRLRNNKRGSFEELERPSKRNKSGWPHI